MKQLKNITAISNFYGRDPEFVLAGGGNTSCKTEEHLFVKGSGTTLADITADGFVKMDRSRLQAIWRRKYPSDPDKREAAVLKDLMNCRYESELHKRPSVETMLHDLFDKTYVVHTHPPLINGLTCARNGEKEAEKLFAGNMIWIPYIDPGYVLASRVRREIEKYVSAHGKQPEIVILQNHGIFIASDTVEGIRRNTNRVVNVLKKKIRKKPDLGPVPFDRERAALVAPVLRMLLKQEGKVPIAVFRTNREIKKLVSDRRSFKAVSSAFSPDHIVYYRDEPLFVQRRQNMQKQYAEMEKAVAAYRIKKGFPPKVVALQGLGVFAVSDSKKTADIALALFLDAVKISVYTGSFGGPKFMTPGHIAFINNWEVESYRKKIAGGTKQEGPCNEKISIVTGSAQGFGRDIAEGLLRNGANVVIADIDQDLAQQNAAGFCEQYGRGKALAVKIDVSSEDAVKDMMMETVLNFGGIDILVSNAGVLKAGSLEQMSKRDFDFVTGINYTAYFLCAKHASEYMKIQNRFDKNYFMDIVQINSKSGLEGSKNNSAYAGGKFGGIGLTQSFAMELVDWNIKVNTICPGNFFEGPLWSHPKKGLFIQYLRTGKVPGAKKVEDVKRFYESKVPMKRGCRTEDVVKALIYIIDQKYETGQALPVTGGQVMLK
jgi:rhamnose utilization protein RhaD (predicted bifunctional aldolase and dehydrogenase)/NAD(P)-dependent dehydrogenase (short-subunit alcohol dehydrogenase family)